MRIQKSYQNEQSKGILYVVPTPIGNLDDITIRALKILEEADVVLAEDTRNTGKLLHHFELKKKMISYHEHNRMERQEQVMDMLKQGQLLALVSDAGMPGISDPGFELIHEIISEDLTVVVLPGANAALTALVGSGLPTDHFYFSGFLPRKKKDREEIFARLRTMETTIIFYESPPHRIQETIQDLAANFGDRNVSIAREITKRYEEYIRGTLEEVAGWLAENPLKGECCIVMEAIKQENESSWWQHLTLKEHVEQLMEREDCSSKDAIKKVAKERDVPKREVYSTYHLK
ncbi:16S rRNA (cytidine(1402)-2'-O)-methyltransferase [Gracilibacillus boraciitolerans]|uniref:16S rRNA (cytidine(1402)-2'-O)-methyltransferase n=1 Tax=Gracilibacillus boraciitolerans TaxID=307521 RepID=UPI000555D28C|nr:16S rRNA (cytidine(1402)-2'-O)-methyltransferase [Gracilibacillus boraciitolerans]